MDAITVATKKFKEKILIITGDGSFGERLLNTLQEGGYQTILVKNGIEGLKKIYDTLPHLILLDIIEPGTDGYDILTEKHREPILTKIPVFLMSTQGVPINMRRVPKDSVAEFIVSLHGDPEYILGRVNRYFNHDQIIEEKIGDPSKAKTIFWIEDDKLIYKIIEKKLSGFSCNLIRAENGTIALEKLRRIIPDIIVLDLLLPGMSGFDVLKTIRADSMLKKTPLLVLSNLSKPSDIERAKTLGANKYIVKATASLDYIVNELKKLCDEKKV